MCNGSEIACIWLVMCTCGFLAMVVVGCVLCALGYMPWWALCFAVVFSIACMAFHGYLACQTEVLDKICTVAGAVALLGAYFAFSWYFDLWHLDASLWLHIPVCGCLLSLIPSVLTLICHRSPSTAYRHRPLPNEQGVEPACLLVTLHAKEVQPGKQAVTGTSMAGEAVASMVVEEDVELGSVRAELTRQIAAPAGASVKLVLPDGRSFAEVTDDAKLAPLLLAV